MKPADLTRIREWVGSRPSDDELDALWAAIEKPSWCRVAMHVLRARYADLVDAKASFSVAGEASVTRSKREDLPALAAQIASLAAECRIPNPLTQGREVEVTRLVRTPDRPARRRLPR